MPIQYQKRSLVSVYSWLKASKYSKIILFLNLSDSLKQDIFYLALKEYIDTRRLEFRSEMIFGYNNLPMIKTWFLNGIKYSRTNFVCFLNFDIIVSPKWYGLCQHIFQCGLLPKNKIVILNSRMNYDIPETDFDSIPKIDYITSNVDSFFEKYKGERLYTGIDLFLFHKTMNCFDFNIMPDFVIGLCLWDSVFTAYFNLFSESISFQYNPPIYHINHGKNGCNTTNWEYVRSIGKSVFNRTHHQNCLSKHAKWKYFVQSDTLISKNGSISHFLGYNHKSNHSHLSESH